MEARNGEGAREGRGKKGEREGEERKGRREGGGGKPGKWSKGEEEEEGNQESGARERRRVTRGGKGGRNGEGGRVFFLFTGRYIMDANTKLANLSRSPGQSRTGGLGDWGTVHRLDYDRGRCHPRKDPKGRTKGSLAAPFPPELARSSSPVRTHHPTPRILRAPA